MSSEILAPPPMKMWPPQAAAARNAPDTDDDILDPEIRRVDGSIQHTTLVMRQFIKCTRTVCVVQHGREISALS